MNKKMFPKTRKLMETELEAWKTVLQAIEDLRRRVKTLEQKLTE